MHCNRFNSTAQVIFFFKIRRIIFSYSQSSLLYRNTSKTKKRTDQCVHSLLVSVIKSKTFSFLLHLLFQFDLLSFYVLLISLVLISLILSRSLCMSKTCSCKCSRSFSFFLSKKKIPNQMTKSIHREQQSIQYRSLEVRIHFCFNSGLLLTFPCLDKMLIVECFTSDTKQAARA